LIAADRLVIDASVAVKWVLPEPGAERAGVLLSALASGDLAIEIPDICVAEITNVLWKRCRRRDELTPRQARQAQALLLDVLPVPTPSAQLVPAALEIALTYRHSVYDCLYVALAERRNCPLVTADRPLVRSMEPATVEVIHLEQIWDSDEDGALGGPAR